MKNNLSKFVFILSLVFGATQVLAIDNSRPDKLVKDLTNKVVKQLKKNKSHLQRNPAAVTRVARKLANKVKPHWDVNTTAAYIIGKPWRSASSRDRKAFIKRFENLLVRTYSKALLQYSDQKIEMLPYRHKAGKKQARVKSRFIRSGGAPVKIEYDLHKKGRAWKIYNAKVGGFNLIKNFRSQYRPVVRKSGLAGLNKILKSR